MLDTNHSLAAAYSGETSSTEDGQHGLAVVVNSIVEAFHLEDFFTEKGLTKYIVRVRARTKFMRGMLSEDGCGEFLIHTRYSELLSLKESLEKEIKIELAKEFSDGPALRRKCDRLTQVFLNFLPNAFIIKQTPRL